MKKNTREAVFVVQFNSQSSENLLVWAIVIATHVDIGLPVLSVPSPCGNPRSYKLPKVKTESARSIKRHRVIANGAKLAEVISLSSIQIWGSTDIPAAVIPGFPFEPGAHVHYQDKALHIKDGLLKLKDVPREVGGSGIELPE